METLFILHYDFHLGSETRPWEKEGTDWGGGSEQASGGERQKQMRRDSHEQNNKQPAEREDVEREGRSELELR